MKLHSMHRSEPAARDLDAIYREHAKFVWRVAASLGVPSDQREDIVHDVFVVVHHKIDEFDAERSMTTWLFGITRMVVLNHRRRAGRHARKLRVVPPPQSPPDPETQHDLRRGAQRVRTFLDSLDRRKRVVFELVELQGMSGPEVARTIGANVDTVYTRLRAARRAFREFVARTRKEGGADG